MLRFKEYKGQRMDISIIIPIFNERKSIHPLYEEITSVMRALIRSYEIIFVDDGSTDGSFDAVKELVCRAASEGVHLKGLHLRRNFGKSEALQTGFQEAVGDILITMDGDMQDDPAEIPRLIEKIEEGFDMVSGWKINRRDSLCRTILSKIFNTTVSLIMKEKLHDMNCGLKAFRREALDGIVIYGEMHRYIPALVSNAGFRVGEIPVNHRPRQYGKSKYGLERIFALHDLITIIFLTRHTNKPLHFMGNVGLFFLLIGTSTISFLYIRKFLFGVYIVHNQFLFFMGLLCVVVGAQFFCMGLLGELIRSMSPKDNTVHHVKERITAE